MVGRTHGVHAEPITFGFKLLLWVEEMRRNNPNLFNNARPFLFNFGTGRRIGVRRGGGFAFKVRPASVGGMLSSKHRLA